MKFMFKCKVCGKEFSQPSKAHIREDYQKMILEFEKATPFQFFDLVFEEEWQE